MTKLCNTTEIIAQQILEEIVMTKIVDGQDISGFCFCPRCWSDVLSLALNNLPPRYVVTEEGEIYARVQMELDPGHKARVYAEIMKALIQVGAKPHHEINI